MSSPIPINNYDRQSGTASLGGGLTSSYSGRTYTLNVDDPNSLVAFMASLTGQQQKTLVANLNNAMTELKPNTELINRLESILKEFPKARSYCILPNHCILALSSEDFSSLDHFKEALDKINCFTGYLEDSKLMDKFRNSCVSYFETIADLAKLENPTFFRLSLFDHLDLFYAIQNKEYDAQFVAQVGTSLKTKLFTRGHYQDERMEEDLAIIFPIQYKAHFESVYKICNEDERLKLAQLMDPALLVSSPFSQELIVTTLLGIPEALFGVWIKDGNVALEHKIYVNGGAIIYARRSDHQLMVLELLAKFCKQNDALNQKVIKSMGTIQWQGATNWRYGDPKVCFKPMHQVFEDLKQRV